METRTYNVYELDELTPELKEKVIENYRDIHTGYGWYQFILEEWTEKLEALGYENIDINFNGFGSQGDGASFTAKSMDLDKWLKVHKRTTHYKKLLKDIHNYGLAGLTGEVYRLTHHYYHENTCKASVDGDTKYPELVDELTAEIESERYELCNQLYKDLQNEYEYLTSDEVILETLKANEYMFNDEGRID